MATFTQDQLTGLNAAYTRQQQGNANTADIANLKYAMSQGWTPTTSGTTSGTNTSSLLSYQPSSSASISQPTPLSITSKTSTVPTITTTPPSTTTTQTKTTAATAPPPTAPTPTPTTPTSPSIAPTTPPPPPPLAPTPTPTPTAPQGQLATLQSPDGTQKVVVTVGSGEASQLQSRGWSLGAPANASVLTLEQALGSTPSAPSAPSTPEVSAPETSITPYNFEDLGINFSDLFNTPATTTEAPTTSPALELLAKYGIQPPSSSGNPVQDYASTYNQLLSSMGIPGIRAEFDKVQEKYNALQNELNDKISGVNDDPWLSEGLRVGQIRSLQNKYEGKLQILSDQQKLYNSLYEQGVEQAKFVANTAYNQQQFNTQTAFNIANLALREQEARASLDSAKLRDKLAIAQEMRMRAAQDSEDRTKTAQNSLNSLKTLADMFGGSLFMNLSSSEKRKWEANAGLPSGTLDYLGQTIEESKINSAISKKTGGGTGSRSIGGGGGISGTGGINTSSLSDEARAVIEGTLRLEDLTPTVRGRIAGELTRAGYKSGPKLSAAQQDDLATMNTTSKLIDDILAYNADGKLEGIGGFYAGSIKSFLTSNFGVGSEEAKNVRQLIGNVRGTIAKLRGGTSFTSSEERLLNTYVPTINESAASVISKLSGLKKFIAEKNASLRSAAADRGVMAPSNVSSMNINDVKNKYGVTY